MTQEPTPQIDTGGGLIGTQTSSPALKAAGALVIIVLTLIAYRPAMQGLFIWDDDHYVVDNTLLRSWEGLGRIWTDVIPRPSEYPLPQYYPLTHTSFWIEYQLGAHDESGLPTPTPYHVTNVVLHIINSLLIWYILARLAVPGAWLAAALFALHPMNAETVAWVTERKNVLSMLFFLASLYVYLRYAQIITPRPGTATREPTWQLPADPNRLYALAIVLFVCALLSKTIANSMPAVALLIIWWKRGRLTGKDFRDAVPLLVVGALFGSLTGYMEHVRVGVGQRPEIWDYSPTMAGEIGARLIIAGRAVWFYVQKLLIPYPLIFNYERWTIDPSNVLAYLFPLSVLAILIALVVMSKRIGRGPAAAALFFVGTLFPALGFVNVWPMQYSFVADHFVYLSCIGLFALVAALLWRKPPLKALGAAVLGLFIVLTWNRSVVMSELKLLWEDTIARSNGQSWMAVNNYGVLIRDSRLLAEPGDRLNESERLFRRAIELKNDYAEPWYNLALVAERRGLLAQRTSATTQSSTRPAATMPTTQQMQFFEQAAEYYRQALARQHNYVPAHFHLANILRIMGRFDQALEHYRKAVEFHPRHGEALQILADHADATGNLPLALDYYGRLVDIYPDDPQSYAQYGWALLRTNNVAMGFEQWDIALGMVPDNPAMANDFGVRMAMAGDFRQARNYFLMAHRISPNSPEVLTNLGVAAARTGLPQEARTFLNEALKHDPNFEKAKQALINLEAGRLGPATTQATTAPTTQAVP